MKTRMSRTTRFSTLLAASVALLAGGFAAAHDTNATALRPEQSTEWHGDANAYPNSLGGYGNGSLPYGDYSQPLNLDSYYGSGSQGGYSQPGYSQPNYNQPTYHQPSYTQPAVNPVCPTCPLQNNGWQNGTTIPAQNWQNNGYDTRIRMPEYNNGNSGGRFQDLRYRETPQLPNQGYPTQSYPNQSYPNQTYPHQQGYPTQQDNRWQQPAPGSMPRGVDENDPHTKITARYQNADMLTYLSRSNLNTTMSLYMEASRMIDSRHVSPTSYEVRTQKAIENLMTALSNETFLRAAGGNADPRQVQALQSELAQIARSNPPRTANEAVGLMQWAADLSNQRLGVRREAVALEFLNGTLDSLDRYSAFVPTKQAYGALDQEELETAALEENIVGVGVELKKHDNGALVMGTVENGPAAKARLLRGDVIVGVDGRSVQGLSLSQIADMISGQAGTPVTFRINRNGQEYTASLRREQVYVSSVAGTQMIDQTTGYVRLKQFSQSSAEDLEKAMWSLYQNGMKTLVLDLRGNPGGLLTEAIQVSNLFVNSGRIVATRGRTASDNSDERATWEKTWRIPLVVLVDGDSASASEIFAAAIQENERGVIVGRQTYGKGTVQTHFPLQSVTGTLKLTTAKFYSPKGREMSSTGVRPDVLVNARTEDTFTANLTSDADVRMSLDVIARGTPATLAANAHQNRVKYDLSLLGN